MGDRPDAALVERIELPRTTPAGMDREDLRQEICLRAVMKKERLRDLEEHEQVAYLRVLGHRVAIDQARRSGRSKRGSGRSRSFHEEPQADQTSPSGKAIRNERSEKLWEALGNLSADQRRAIQLRHLDGCSLSEVAQAMGTTVASVAGLLRRGLAQLREVLTEPDS
jgi:RNA polymerase sigma-70 factor (ECF subfamily)